MTALAAWESAVAEWQRMRALMDAFYEIGPMYRSNEEWSRTRRDLEDRYGSIANAKEDPIGCKELDEKWTVCVANDARQPEFYDPADEAARVLVRTPAPHLNAVLLKIEVTKRHELHFADDMDAEPWTIIEAELRAMGGGA